MLASCLLGVFLAGLPPSLVSGPVGLLVRAGDRDCAAALVTATLDRAPRAMVALKGPDGSPVPAQVRREGSRLLVSWVVPAVSKGQTLRYSLDVGRAPEPAPGISVKRVGADVEVRVGADLFARYDATTGPNKPYFHPIFAPGQKMVVRGWPVARSEVDQTQDHPHHRGLWFTHGSVDGVDYWSEGARTGRTVPASYSDLVSGPVYGGFTAKTEWRAPDGAKVAEDVRTFRFYATPNARIMDVDIVLRPNGRPLTFGDTKEGSFGLRVADTLRVADEKGRKLEGHIETSMGVKDGAAWGKRAEWVDYWGPVGGETVGVAIFDHPESFRHPTTWHVRDYGLFAANPFGIHDFERGQPRGAGDLVLQPDQKLHLRYRVVFHKGGTAEAKIADLWNAYAHPPTVSIER